MPSPKETPVPSFSELNLPAPLLKALNKEGYETPSPIQAAMIPHVLAGRDVIGQAQTGTGKTAAFALPLLANLDLKQPRPQVLVLTPTRELAIQVAEAFQRYAAHMKDFHVLPIYGGQDPSIQLRQLKRRVHVVVGTPGRVMDHMRRGSLNLVDLRCLVLDEADEMLRMGFVDDVEWVLAQTPPKRQVTLFSATMPASIRKIAQKYLHDPMEITIKEKTTTAKTVHQRYLLVNQAQKLDSLTRIMESETFDAMLIFVRTKTATVELAEKLSARGFAASALNGDIQQSQRTRLVENLRKGTLDIIAATDVAARGLDVPRISHVVNYDIPHDTESYVHRIGRTGRAGKAGEAILLITHREKRMLATIEKATGQKVEMMNMPSVAKVNENRIAGFKERITQTLSSEDLSLYADLVEGFQKEHGVAALDIAAALARMVQGETPLLLNESPAFEKKESRPFKEQPSYGKESRPPFKERAERKEKAPVARKPASDTAMETYRIEVGSSHGVKPGNIVGAIAGEADIDSKFIGSIAIFDDYSTVDLPAGMPQDLFDLLQAVWVSGKQLRISRLGGGKQPYSPARKKTASKPRTTASKPRTTRPSDKKRDTVSRGVKRRK
ncbi:MAG: DEAD/DEAH box helicase [Proteobacteria bacterium]|nr:DEAD/DEAH box helicase [Pseudomonadota bacterium]MBU1641524.1 DEAD/DEAH box helicase [Pseudomonadota bacterium]